MPHILCVDKSELSTIHILPRLITFVIEAKPYHSRRDRHDNIISPSSRLNHESFTTEIAYGNQLLMSSSRSSWVLPRMSLLMHILGYPSGESFYSQDYGVFVDMVKRDPISPTSSSFSSLSSERRSGSDEFYFIETPSKRGPLDVKMSSGKRIYVVLPSCVLS